MQIKLCKMAQLLMLNQFTARFELLNYLLFLIANLKHLKLTRLQFYLTKKNKSYIEKLNFN